MQTHVLRVYNHPAISSLWNAIFIVSPIILFNIVASTQ